jgi:hypothetical protein
VPLPIHCHQRRPARQDVKDLSYEKHTQAYAIDFMVHVISKFLFRICQIRTHIGHEFQAKSRWHVADLDIRDS